MSFSSSDFNGSSVEKVKNLLSFSEQEFDFTRCKRPDGSVYGTAGKCRKGTETAAKEKAPVTTQHRSSKVVRDELERARSMSGADAKNRVQKLRQELHDSSWFEAKTKVIDDNKKIVKAHLQAAADQRKKGNSVQAEYHDDVARFHARYIKEAQDDLKKGAPPIPKMSVDLDTPEGRWFAARKGF